MENEIIVPVIYSLIGLSGALSIVVFVWGFIIYIARLGTERRAEGIHIMIWAIRLILTALFLIAFLKLVQSWFGLT